MRSSRVIRSFLDGLTQSSEPLRSSRSSGRHGYKISKLIDSRSEGALTFNVASLYPMLYRLEGRGWIQGRWNFTYPI